MSTEVEKFIEQNLPQNNSEILSDEETRRLASLGSTRAGREFVIAAIDPALSGVHCPGIPANHTGNGKILTYQIDQHEVKVQAPTSDPTASWNIKITLLAHPIAVASVLVWTTPVGLAQIDYKESFIVYNKGLAAPPLASLLPETTWANKQANTALFFDTMRTQILQIAKRVRQLKSSVTGTLDQQDLNNAGMVRAGIVGVDPEQGMILDGLHGKFIDSFTFDEFDIPLDSSSIIDDKKYVGKASDGIYAVMPLDEKMAEWKSLNSYAALDWPTTTSLGDAPGTTIDIPRVFPSLENRHPTIRLLNNNINEIWIENIHPTASISLNFHYAFEFDPYPQSIVMPYFANPIGDDYLAIESYKKTIQKVLASGYPAKYNAFGWLKKIASFLSPYIGAAAEGALGGFKSGGAVGAAVGALSGIGQKVLDKYGQKQQMLPQPKRTREEPITEQESNDEEYVVNYQLP